MAKNANHGLKNRHVSIVAASGGGKSQLGRNDVVPKTGARCIFWDVDEDHKANRYSNRGEFLRALKSASGTGKPFKIAWVGDDDEKTFAWFCEVVWAVLDGRRDTWVVLEEMADQNMGQTMPPWLKKLIVRGRKYGAIVVTTTQRCQEVPKALITQPKRRFYGQHFEQDAAYMQRLTRIKAEEFESLPALSFFERGEGSETRIFRTKYVEYHP